MDKLLKEIDKQKESKSEAKQKKAHQDIVDELERKFNTAKLARATIEAQWQEAEDEYQNLLTDSSDGMANIKLPILFSVVQTKLSEELSSFPQIKLIPKTELDIDRAERLKLAYDDSLTRGRFNYNLYKIFMAKDLLGTGIGREAYHVNKRVVKDLEFNEDGDWKRDKKGELVVKEKVVFDKDDLVFEYVDVRRFYPDPHAVDMETCGWCFELEEVDYDTFMMYAKQDGIYIEENLKLVKPENTFDFNYPFGLPYQNEEEKGKHSKMTGGQGEGRDKSSNRILLIKYTNKIRDELIWIANGILIRKTPIPYAHKQLGYCRFVNHMELNSFWGRSEFRVLNQIIEEKNNFRNLMTDWAKININRPILRGQTDFDDEDLYFEPGAIWDVGDVNQIKQLQLGDLPNGLFGLENKMEQDAVAFTGIDYRTLIQGQDETATRSAIKQEKALKRIGMGLRVVDWTGLEPFAEMRLANIQQFYTQKRMETIINENGEELEELRFRRVRVKDKEAVKDAKGNVRFYDSKGTVSFFDASPENIRAQVDVEAVTGSTLSASREVDRQNFNTTLQTLAAYPQLMERIDWDYVGEELAKKNNLDPGKFLISNDQPEEAELLNSNLPTEQLLAEAGVARPGEGVGGPAGEVAPGIPTEQLLAEGFNLTRPNEAEEEIFQPGGPQPAARG